MRSKRTEQCGSPSAAPPVLSFVLPAYNEERNLAVMTRRLLAVGAKTAMPFEILWVNDGSSDRTAELLDQLAERHHEVRVVHFSRNFGHMAALTAGLEQARGTGAVITLDADGQHPPQLIPKMIALWLEGADIVQTVRRQTADASWFKQASSSLFYKILNALSGLNVPEGAADFRLLDREVVDVFCQLPERERFIRGLIQWVGFRRVELPYKARARMAGTTKYNFRKMLSLSLLGITAFSTKPLRLSFMLGMMVLLLALVYGAYVLAAFALGIALVPGWASQLMTILILGGIQLVMLGIVSEYLGRLYQESKGRPIYIIRMGTRSDREPDKPSSKSSHD